jgi:hypothetical protein
MLAGMARSEAPYSSMKPRYLARFADIGKALWPTSTKTMQTELTSLGNGFYADDEDNVYFRATEFLGSNGLPVKRRLVKMAIEEVLELDPGIRVLTDDLTGLLH